MTILDRRALALLVLISTSACSGSIEFNKGPGTFAEASAGKLPGYPVPTQEYWVIKGLYTALSKGGGCDKVPYQKIVSLATGPVLYIQPKPPTFGKGEFSVKQREDGTVSELTFNSESKPEELLKALPDLLGALPLGSGGAQTAVAGALPSCDTGEEPGSLTRFKDWLPG